MWPIWFYLGRTVFKNRQFDNFCVLISTLLGDWSLKITHLSTIKDTETDNQTDKQTVFCPLTEINEKKLKTVWSTHSPWLCDCTDDDDNNIIYSSMCTSWFLVAVHTELQWVTEKKGKNCFFKCLCQFSVRTRWYFWVSTRPKAIFSPCYGVRPALNSSGTKIRSGNVSNGVTAALQRSFQAWNFLFPQHDSQGLGSVRVFQIPSTENSMTSEHVPVCPGTVLEAQLVKLTVAQLR